MIHLGNWDIKGVEYKILKDASGRHFAMSTDGNYVTLELADDMVEALLATEAANN